MPGGVSTVIGTKRRTTPDLATFANGAAIRYFDFNDLYFGREPGHPSDNITACLAIAEAEGRNGRDFLLAMLHPFMPFITEELWARTAVPDGRASLLIEAMWPAVKAPPAFEIAQKELEWVIELVKGVRSVRAEMNVPPSAKIALLLKDASPAERENRIDEKSRPRSPRATNASS